MFEIPNPLILQRSSAKNSSEWVSPSTNELMTVEQAVAGWFRKQGYYVSHSGEYGHILNALLLSLMFDNFRYHNAEDRTVYRHIVTSGLMTYESARRIAARKNIRADLQNDSWEFNLAKDHEELIKDAPYRSREVVKNNLRKILPRVARRKNITQKADQNCEETVLGVKSSEASQLSCALALLTALGNDGVLELAKYRAKKHRNLSLTGWPDLLIWNGESCSFQEVKSPNDRPSDRQLEALADIQKIGINCGILSVASPEEPMAFFKPQIEVDKPPAKVVFDNTTLNQNPLTLSTAFDELLVGMGGLYSLVKSVSEEGIVSLPESLHCFFTDTDGCRYPYDPIENPTSFFSNGCSDANNFLLNFVENKHKSYYHELVKIINRRKIFILDYLSQVSIFELVQGKSYLNLPRVRLVEINGKLKFNFSIGLIPIGGPVTKPLFMKKIIPTLEALCKIFPLSEGVSEQQFLSWYCFYGNGNGDNTPIRARNLQEAVFKYTLFYRSLPPGPMILESDQKFPGKNRLHDKRLKLPITEDFIHSVRHTKVLFDDMGTIKLRTVPLGYSF